MAHASKNHMGKSAGGKKSGSGAMTPESSVDDVLGENQVLSNRDKAVAHNQERGLDSQHVQNEQRQDNASNRQVPADPLATSGGIPAPSSTGSGEDSSLKSRRGEAGGLADPDPGDDRR